MNKSLIQRISIIVIISALIGGAYFMYLKKQNASSPSMDAVTVEQGAAQIGGPFELTDQDGRKVTDQDFKSKKLLVFFGYTSCPDECPVTMAVMSEVMNQLESTNVKNVQPIFITTDPDTDKPAVIKKYLKDYHHGFIGLTGSKEELEKVQKEYKVYVEDAPAHMEMKMEHGDLSKHAGKIGHSALIYYMDENGKYLDHFNRESAPEDIVDKIGK